MKRFSCFAFGLVAVFLATSATVSKAAVGTVTIEGLSTNFTFVSQFLQSRPVWVNSVTLSNSFSLWLGAEAHYNLSTGQEYAYIFQGMPILGGTVSDAPWIFEYGRYDCYVTDSGTAGILPMVPWALDTNHITVTVMPL